MLEKIVDKYFGFLEREFGFKKIPEYNYVREIHNDYIRNNVIIKICYEGSYEVELMISKSVEKDLTDGLKKTVDYEYKFFKRYNLKKLDVKDKLYKSLTPDNLSEINLLYYSEILKNNPEILTGNMDKFSLKYRIFQQLGIR